MAASIQWILKQIVENLPHLKSRSELLSSKSYDHLWQPVWWELSSEPSKHKIDVPYKACIMSRLLTKREGRKVPQYVSTKIRQMAFKAGILWNRHGSLRANELSARLAIPASQPTTSSSIFGKFSPKSIWLRPQWIPFTNRKLSTRSCWISRFLQ